ncbi:uncharacterized protein LOC108094123 [Drosophila ficusphila]|uniref:uncharacterized protein LOC108094123 n=1 Tax=Drosophila ficusphila TaxID=30025 RepID=UPI0007E699E3|nr:uncharacterized protein LOC108094123 [Drosophila ficusphila]
MIVFTEWLTTISAGILASAPAIWFLKRVNEEESPAKISGHLETAVIDGLTIDEPKILGSERICNVLQHIFSSEPDSSHVYIDAMHNRSANKQNYALGSESLNRMLEDIMSSAESVNSRSLSMEPAVEV